MKKLPLSIQTFEDIISGGMIYVDKTKYIYQLLSEGKYYFLSRPRRFGKSLLLTTLKSFFEGKNELFKGLYLEEKVREWTFFPVVHIDYSRIGYRESAEIFKRTLLDHLRFIASDYDVTLTKEDIPTSFEELVGKLYEKYNQKVVILIDEYDKPLVDLLSEPQRFEENRGILRDLYGTIKGLDSYLRFVMLTGVSRFAKLSVFSGMNNLDDISMNKEYSQLTGFTQEELEAYFGDHLNKLGDTFSLTVEELRPHIQEWYNGFSFDGIHKLYNPFSILKLFTEYEFRNYWFSTGTPTFLIDLIKTQKQLPERFEHLKTTDLTGSSMQIQNLPLIPLLYQTGYLTIESSGRDGLAPYYYLNYPNREVRHSFLTYIAAAFKSVDEFEIQPEALALRDALKDEDIDLFVRSFQSFLADIPARLHIAKEAYYHKLVYIMLQIIGSETLLEKETDKGRIDAVLLLPDKTYIIEFKFAMHDRVKQASTLSQKALKQIKDKQYYQAYISKAPRILLLGLGFLDKNLHGRIEELTFN